MLVDVFAQTFVMLFPLGGLASQSKTTSTYADEIDFLVLLEIIVYWWIG